MIILDTLTPAAGSNSFNVTTGPWFIFFTSPSTPKSSNIFSKNFTSMLLSFSFSLSFLEGKSKISTLGSLNFKFLKLFTFKLSKGRFSWTLFSENLSPSFCLKFISSKLLILSFLKKMFLILEIFFKYITLKFTETKKRKRLNKTSV